jgi:hypothetical protein
MGEQSFTLEPQRVVLRLDGMPTPVEAGLNGEGFIRDPSGAWRPLLDDGLYAIEHECVSLHAELAATIFGSLELYHALLPVVPPILSQAGLNSESSLSREQFEELLAKLATFSELNRFLYLYDCRMLVSAIQECTKEVRQLVGEFYRILNLEPFFTPGVPLEDGVRWSTSPTVTSLTATLGFIFVRLHSLLDYSAKLARETDCLKTDFKAYPRLASSGFLFGKRSGLRINKKPGSLFEDADEIAEIKLIRNLVIHDGLLDDMPKAYEVIESGKPTERYLLMPDRKGGQFESFKNRRLFYGREDKINRRLPLLIRAFQAREVETLKLIRVGLKMGGDSTNVSFLD